MFELMNATLNMTYKALGKGFRMEDNRIKKLPKWVQEHIKKLERERDVSVRALNESCDDQSKSPIYYEDNVCTGEKSGPSVKRKYIQSHGKITVNHEGIQLDILCREGLIDLRWSNDVHGDVALIPDSYQGARLVSRDNMR